jgi:hypothetical protein
MSNTKQGREVAGAVQDAHDLYTIGRVPIENEIVSSAPNWASFDGMVGSVHGGDVFMKPDVHAAG